VARGAVVLWVQGDIVKVHRGDDFPADVVFLAAGGEDAWQRSICYVQTLQVTVPPPALLAAPSHFRALSAGGAVAVSLPLAAPNKVVLHAWCVPPFLASQLDGETNLKLRRALNCTVAIGDGGPDAWAAFRGCVHCEEPTPFFDKFTGMLYLQPVDLAPAPQTPSQPATVGPAPTAIARVTPSAPVVESTAAPPDDLTIQSFMTTAGDGTAGSDLGPAPAAPVAPGGQGRSRPSSPSPASPLPLHVSFGLDADQLLLRGCTLMNSAWIVGLVVYTGDQTKVRVKQQEVRQKVPSVERQVCA
jgi:hypothetical protein